MWKKARRLWRAAPLVLFGALWKERNRITFEEASFFPNRINISIVWSLFTWAGCHPNVDVSSFCSMRTVSFCLKKMVVKCGFRKYLQKQK